MPSTGTSPEIPLFDLQLAPEDIDAVLAVLRSGRLSMGPRTSEFERAFAEHLGVRHAVAVSSGTAALHLAYLTAGVGAGDEVIVPAITFVATAAAAIHCGATPVFADIAGPHDLSLDVGDVAKKITARTKAVCAVHYAGYPAPVRRLRELCDQHGLVLIEDAAHAPDADVDGRRMGGWGRSAAFSFFSNKVLSCGEGGLLATDDDGVAAQARSLREPGGAGFNYRFDEPRAALLLSRLSRLERDVMRRRERTRAYRAKLRGLDGLSLPYTDADVDHSSCYVMPLIVDDGARRDRVRRQLRERHGVQTSLLYPAVHELAAYRERYGRPHLPCAEQVARSEITVPLFPELDEASQDRVVTALAEALA